MISSASLIFWVGPHGDRIDDHAGLALFDLIHFIGLACDDEVLVDDAETPLPRHADGGTGLGNGVHGGTDKRNIQRYVAGNPGSQIGVTGENQ